MFFVHTFLAARAHAKLYLFFAQPKQSLSWYATADFVIQFAAFILLPPSHLALIRPVPLFYLDQLVGLRDAATALHHLQLRPA
jgi:hypothetical protein